MEPRNYESGAAETPPTAPETPSSGYPISGNPSTGTPATKPGSFWIYKVGESLRRVIIAAGLTPSDNNLDLLKDSIQALSASKASQPEVDAGANDTKFVTPLKLRFGFAISLTSNGYVVFPSWLGGLIIQWGRHDGTLSDTNAIVDLPIVFPNNFFMAMSNCEANINVTGAANISSHCYRFSNSQIRLFESGASANSTGMFWLAIGN